MPRKEALRIAILGAGPIGLEAALWAHAHGLSFSVYERGRVGEHLRRWGHVRMFSPFGMNTTPEGKKAIRKDAADASFPTDSDLITGREHVKTYLEPLSQNSLIRPFLHEGVEVVQVGRRGWFKGDHDPRRLQASFRLLLRDTKGKESLTEADVVLDCTGTYAQPRFLGDGGIPALGEREAAPQIAYHLEDVLGERAAHYGGKTVLVVGAGYSAATAVCHLTSLAEKNPATWVIWLSHGPSTQPLRRIPNDPLRERDRIAVRANSLATRGEGLIEFYNQAVLESVEYLGADKGFRVGARIAGQPRNFEVDRVLALVGTSPDYEIIRELQIKQCPYTMAPEGAPFTTEPGYYILGAKSNGRNPNFLLRQGFDQLKDVFAKITEL